MSKPVLGLFLGTILGLLDGSSRIVPAWQVAQLSPTRPFLLVVPMNRSPPTPSLMKPSRS